MRVMNALAIAVLIVAALFCLYLLQVKYEKWRARIFYEEIKRLEGKP